MTGYYREKLLVNHLWELKYGFLLLLLNEGKMKVGQWIQTGFSWYCSYAKENLPFLGNLSLLLSQVAIKLLLL